MEKYAKRPTLRDVEIAALAREVERTEQQKIANARKTAARKAAGITTKTVQVHADHGDFFESTLKTLFKTYFARPAAANDPHGVRARIEDILADLIDMEERTRADQVRPAGSIVTMPVVEGEDENNPFGTHDVSPDASKKPSV